MSWGRKNIVIILAIVVAVFGLMAVRLVKAPTEKDISEIFITANPFDLAQIKSMSKYRSCEGHDYRAPTLSGEMETTPRSMKHYVAVKPEFRGTTDAVNVFAPFAGKISFVEKEGSANDSQVWLTPDSDKNAQWQFIFFHLNLNEGLKENSVVASGQHIGTANLKRGPDDATDNFDIALKFMRPFRRPAVEAPFKHVAPDVLEEYKKYGLTIDDLIVSKEYRDANPCPVLNNKNEPDIMFPPGSIDDYVGLTSPTLQ